MERWRHALLFLHSMKFFIWKALEIISEYKVLPRDAIHAATAFIAGAEVVFSEDRDFDGMKGLKRKWKK